jgi:hypothetical protein
VTGPGNIAVDLGTIRWTDPKTGRRASFAMPVMVRDMPIAVGRGIVPEPFRFILGRDARAARPSVRACRRRRTDMNGGEDFVLRRRNLL